MANIMQLMNDGFEPWFDGVSWNTWKAVLKDAYCLPMSSEELATFKELAGGRSPPKKARKGACYHRWTSLRQGQHRVGACYFHGCGRAQLCRPSSSRRTRAHLLHRRRPGSGSDRSWHDPGL